MSHLTIEGVKIERDTQNFAHYPTQAYDNWKQLLKKQLKSIEGKASQQFIEGLTKIITFIEGIPHIANLSQFLQEHTGWQLWPVKGLLESESFFYLLSHRYFPVATFVRSGTDFNYSPIPDLWHDIFGHIPLLFFPAYSNLVEYLSYQYIARQDLKEAIARLYWYTIEAGVCDEGGNRRVYGASQLSSIEEIGYAVSDYPIVYPFDLEKVIDCPVKIDQLQHQIFEIPSFDYLSVIEYEFDRYLQCSSLCR
ncbi:MAG: hypothetical protein F6J86_19610 [Symploca sp. SIO1B1]|nr:hypothetical protein [Symploca sp. SIO1C2]NER96019.1 hypothetical protein [Symploca sp. SIO1B1]